MEKDSKEKDSKEKTNPEENKNKEEENVVENYNDKISFITSKTSDEISDAIGTARTLNTKNEDEKQKENLDKILEELKAIQASADENQKKLLKLIKVLSDKKQITIAQAKEIIDLNGDSTDFESKLKKIEESLNKKVEEEDLKNLIKEKKEEAEKQKKVKEDFDKVAKSLSVELEKAEQNAYKEAYKEMSIKEYSKQLGFELKAGTEVRFRYLRPVLTPVKDRSGNIIKDSEGNNKYTQEKDSSGELLFEPIFRKAKIKEVKFKNYSVDKGEEKKVVSYLTPSVVLEIEDQWPDKNNITNKLVTELSAGSLQEAVDLQDVVVAYEEKSNIEEELKEVEKITGLKIQEGLSLSFREISTEGDKVKGKDRQVKITKISKEKDEFFSSSSGPNKDKTQTMIELDQEVITKHYPVKKMESKMSLGQFIKWVSRFSVEKFEELSIEDLRNKLVELNKSINSKYSRDSKTHPPIELVEGENLYYDTNPPSIFKIKSIDDGKITLENGDEYTPSSFLKWVKDNEVGKYIPAEGEEKEEHKEDLKDESKKDKSEKDKKNNTKKDGVPEGYSTESSEKPSPPSVGYLRKLYSDTYFLSFNSFYEIGKQIMDFIKVRLERKEKERIGNVGKRAFGFIPQLGGEFERIRKMSESEEINYYKEDIEKYGFEDIFKRLQNTKNKSEFTAILEVMAEKGAINWRDKTLWNALLRIASQEGVNLKGLVHTEENIKKIIDDLWGPGSFNSWNGKNDSNYQGKVEESKQWAKRLENDPEKKGGMRGRLQDLLYKHITGELTSAPMYESLLVTAIEDGKLTFADKIYFIIMGFGMEGRGLNEGRPILNWYSLNKLEGVFANKFPILNYFSDDGILKVDSKGKPIWDPNTSGQAKGQIGINELQNIIRNIIEKDAGKKITSITGPAEFSPGQGLQNFIESEMILNGSVATRLREKASMDLSNWDHDDFHIFGSQINERQVESIARRTGAKQDASLAAIKNTFAGLNHFSKRYLDTFIEDVKNKNEEGAQENITRLLESIKTLLKLDAVVGNRYNHDLGDYVRFTRSDYKSFAGVEANKRRNIEGLTEEVYTFVTRLFRGMEGVVPKRNIEDLKQTWDIVFEQIGPSERLKQKKQTEAHDSFGQKLENALAIMQEKVGNEGIAKVFYSIQKGSGKDGNLIKGIEKQATTKEEINQREEAQKTRYKLEREQEEDLNKLLKEYRKLMKEKARKPEDIVAEKEDKIKKIINKIEEGNYGEVSMDEERYLRNLIENEKNRG